MLDLGLINNNEIAKIDNYFLYDCQNVVFINNNDSFLDEF